MKRARNGAASIAKLNVGGKIHHVNMDTLAGLRFFEPMLEGRFSWSTDEAGHVFIDRDGEIFSIILQAHRTMQRPDQQVEGRTDGPTGGAFVVFLLWDRGNA